MPGGAPTRRGSLVAQQLSGTASWLSSGTAAVQYSCVVRLCGIVWHCSFVELTLAWGAWYASFRAGALTWRVVIFYPSYCLAYPPADFQKALFVSLCQKERERTPLAAQVLVLAVCGTLVMMPKRSP